LVSLRVFQGDLDKVQHENPLLLPKGIPIVRKLGFPDVIMPGLLFLNWEDEGGRKMVPLSIST